MKVNNRGKIPAFGGKKNPWETLPHEKKTLCVCVGGCCKPCVRYFSFDPSPRVRFYKLHRPPHPYSVFISGGRGEFVKSQINFWCKKKIKKESVKSEICYHFLNYLSYSLVFFQKDIKFYGTFSKKCFYSQEKRDLKKFRT